MNLTAATPIRNGVAKAVVQNVNFQRPKQFIHVSHTRMINFSLSPNHSECVQLPASFSSAAVCWPPPLCFIVTHAQPSFFQTYPSALHTVVYTLDQIYTKSQRAIFIRSRLWFFFFPFACVICPYITALAAGWVIASDTLHAGKGFVCVSNCV